MCVRVCCEVISPLKDLPQGVNVRLILEWDCHQLVWEQPVSNDGRCGLFEGGGGAENESSRADATKTRAHTGEYAKELAYVFTMLCFRLCSTLATLTLVAESGTAYPTCSTRFEAANPMVLVRRALFACLEDKERKMGFGAKWISKCAALTLSFCANVTFVGCIHRTRSVMCCLLPVPSTTSTSLLNLPSLIP